MLGVPSSPGAAVTEISARQVARVLGFVAVAVAYALALRYVYVNWFASEYWQQGYTVQDVGAVRWVAFILSVGVIALVLGFEVRRFSDFFNWIQFAFLVFPALLFGTLRLPHDEGFFVFVPAVVLSVLLTVVVPRIVRFRPPVLQERLSVDRLGSVLFVAGLGIAAYLVWTFRDIIRLPGIEAIYEQRELASESGAAAPVWYLLNWLMVLVCPFLAAYALRFRRRYGYLLFAVAGVVLVYSINGYKFGVAGIGLLLALHVVLKGGPTGPRIFAFFAAIFVAGALILGLVGFFLEGASLFLVSQVLMRGFGAQAIMLPNYFLYFGDAPRTFYSHNRLVGAFIDYPYDLPLGRVVGIHYSGSFDFNANSGYIATDGFAAAGVPGVLIVSCVVALFLVVMNGVVERDRLRLACLAAIPFIVVTMNTSFFTALLTSGGFLLPVLFWLSRPVESG